MLWGEIPGKFVEGAKLAHFVKIDKSFNSLSLAKVIAEFLWFVFASNLVVLLKPVLKEAPGRICGSGIALRAPLVNHRAYSRHEGNPTGTTLSRDNVGW